MHSLQDALAKFNQKQQREQSERREAETLRERKRRKSARFLDLKITIDESLRWRCDVFAVGDPRPLDQYSGSLFRRGGSSYDLAALNAAARRVLPEFAGARIQTVEVNSKRMDAVRFLLSPARPAPRCEAKGWRAA